MQFQNSLTWCGQKTAIWHCFPDSSVWSHLSHLSQLSKYLSKIAHKQPTLPPLCLSHLSHLSQLLKTAKSTGFVFGSLVSCLSHLSHLLKKQPNWPVLCLSHLSHLSQCLTPPPVFGQAPPTLGWMWSAKNMQNRAQLGEPVLKKHEPPQARWADQYSKKKSETPSRPAGQTRT